MEEQIVTTLPKAKEIRRLAEKMVTLAKRGTLHARREAIRHIRQRDAVAKLFRETAGRYEGRNGGYTRIVRMNRRIGDAAEMCILQFIRETPDQAPGEQTPAGAEAAQPTAADSVPVKAGDEATAEKQAGGDKPAT